ncbi:hypothetical protein GCM10027431_01140 [Lysobacter rhizosphaerae]
MAGGSRAIDWLDDSGSERDLVKTILTQRLDEVRVTSLSLERIERCHRLGFPSTTAEPLLQLHAPRDGGDEAANAPGEGPVSLDTNAWTMTAEPQDEASTRAIARRLRAKGDDVQIPLGQTTLLRMLMDAGFRHEGTLWAARLLPALSQSVLPAFEHEFSVSEEDVQTYGQQSGDLNPLHFDDAFARSHGFERRISHGMLFNGWLTRLLGTEHPGPGTIFLRNSANFFAPVYADLPYRVRISTPKHDDQKGIFLVVAQLFDASGRHCAVSYNEVMLRQPKA